MALSHGAGSWGWLGSVGVLQMSRLNWAFEQCSWERLWDLLLLALCLSQFTLKAQFSVHLLHWNLGQKKYFTKILSLPKIFVPPSNYWILTELVKSSIFIELTFCFSEGQKDSLAVRSFSKHGSGWGAFLETLTLCKVIALEQGSQSLDETWFQWTLWKALWCFEKTIRIRIRAVVFHQLVTVVFCVENNKNH